MIYDNSQFKYRVALNTQTQTFIAYDASDETKVGYGITIEKAVEALKNLI